MAKYRLLTKIELKELEKEFIQYLIMNSITADDWQKLKKEDAARAEEITDLFSDVVFEKILRTAQFLKLLTPKYMNCMQCLNEKIVLYSLKVQSDNVNLIELDNWSDIKANEVEIIYGEKKYTESREIDMFNLILEGAEITDGKWFKQLSLAYADM